VILAVWPTQARLEVEMVALVIAGSTLVVFVGLYVAGVVEARADARRAGRAWWPEEYRPLPRAQVRIRRS
jgi:hypothetical protein